jgi:hypothetical protein
LQVLPLAFALAWNPPDPKCLLDFLLLPASPVPRWAANRLASRVAETPGVGGPLWQEVFEEIAKRFAEKSPEDSEAKRAAAIASWRAFVEPERHDPILGMPHAAARAIAGRVAAWAAARFGATEDGLFMALATAASDLGVAIEATEAERFDRLLIERMIEQVIGAGVSDPTALAEAAPWRTVAHPGAIWGPANTIIWWHFADNGEIAQRAIWDSDEREALKQVGVLLDDPSPALRRISHAWERPVRHARKKLILVRPSMAGGEEVKSHPLWHALVAGRPDLEKRIGARAETILSEPAPQFAGRILIRREVEPGLLPKRRAEWSAPADRIAPREFESASSLSSLLSCPLQWTLNYVSSLEGGVRQSLAGGDALFGTLAHKIAETLFKPGAPPDPGEAVILARALLEEFLPQMAATLLLPGAARDLATARQAIPEAQAELARFLRANKLSVVAMEKEFKDAGTLDASTGIRGWIDLLAKDENGRHVVIDLKWQRTDKYRRKEIADGIAIQLAVYARHVGDAKTDVPTGYFRRVLRPHIEIDVLLLRAERPWPEAQPAVGQRIAPVDVLGGPVTHDMETEGIVPRAAFEIGEDHHRPFQAFGAMISQDGDGVPRSARRLLAFLLRNPGTEAGDRRRRAILFALVFVAGDESAENHAASSSCKALSTRRRSVASGGAPPRLASSTISSAISRPVCSACFLRLAASPMFSAPPRARLAPWAAAPAYGGAVALVSALFPARAARGAWRAPLRCARPHTPNASAG